MRRIRDRWIVRAISFLVAIMGLVNVLSASTPALADRIRLLRPYLPLETRQGAHLVAVVSGFALLVLSQALWRRKRVAWVLTLAWLCISAASHLVKGLDYEEASLALALAVGLWSQQTHFQARSDPPSLRQGLLTLVAALTFTLAYSTLGFFMLDRHFRMHYDFGAALWQALNMFVALNDPGLTPTTGFGRYFADSIYVVAVVTIAYALWMVLRPVLVRTPASAAERRQAQAVVHAHGCTSLARFALLDDKSYLFTPGGSVVPYVATDHVGLVLGDPIGPAEDRAAAIQAYLGLCLKNDWRPAFYQTQPDALPLYDAAGLHSLCIGEEAIIDLNAFTLAGGGAKGWRAIVNKFTKSGVCAVWHDPPHDDVLLAALRKVSDEWLAARGTAEMRFSVGWFDAVYLDDCALLVVYAPGGAVWAFANVVPEYQHNELTLDLMRHATAAEKSTMDFLFLSLFQAAKERGYTSLNLGLSALAGIGTDEDDPRIEKALRLLYEYPNSFYNFQGLHQYKDKFHPTWSPRYLVYRSVIDLPSVVLALTHATSGQHALRDAARGLLRRESADAATPATITQTPGREHTQLENGEARTN